MYYDAFVSQVMDTPINPKYEPTLDTTYGVTKVGVLQIPPCSTLTALLYGFANAPHTHYSAREYYFWRICDELWNGSNTPKKMMERNPWAEKMIYTVIRNKYVAVGGAASSSKSHTMAAWGIINFLSNPSETLILITSTTLREAKKRIWGSVMKLLSYVPNGPFKIRDSIGSIAYVDQNGTLFDTAGLSLIAAEKRNTREAVGKFIGIKQENMILIGDELSEISEAVLHAGLSNLSKQQGRFSMIGMSNPDSLFDAFGVWAEPEGGWETVDVLTAMGWNTRWGGVYIRLDGESSPNIEAGKTIYPYLTTQDMIDEDRKLLGETSRGYMRMIRAVFFDSDEAEGIYTESEITKSGALNTNVVWRETPNIVVGIDLGFTNDGDNTSLTFGLVGYNTDDHYVCKRVHTMNLFDDATSDIPRSYQIARQIKEACVSRGVKPENVAVDVTGAGGPFCDILMAEWSPKILLVTFGGKASSIRTSVYSKKTGEEQYENRVSELWFVGKELMRCKQIYGITRDMARNISQRGYDHRKTGGNLRIFIESKPKYKARIGKSPDEEDSVFLMIDCARQRCGLMAMEPISKQDTGGQLRAPKKSMASIQAAMRNPNTKLAT